MKWQPTQLTKLTVGVFGAVIVLLLLVISSISIHFRELEILLQRSAFLQGESGHAHMAAKFINQMKLYRNELSQSQVDEQEVMMDLVMTSKLESANELALALNSIDKMNIALINGLRSFMRQPPLPEQSDVVLFANLQNAFHLERSKEYALALAYYDKIFAAHPNMSEYHKSVIFLHQGFCHMVLGSQAKARVLFLQVMALQKGQGLDITASLLISYLDAILAEKQKIQDTTLTSARKLTHLMQCEQALQILEGLQVANASQRAEAHLLKGLCYEEIGQKPKAIHAYAKALEHHGKAQTAQDANRRLFVMSTRVQSKTRQSLRTIVAQVDSQYKDTSLAKMQEALNTFEKEKQALEAKNEEFIKQPGVNDSVVAIEPALMALYGSLNRENQVPVRLPAQGTRVRLLIKGDKTLTGTLESKPSDKVVRIQTMIGLVGVEHRDVLSVSER